MAFTPKFVDLVRNFTSTTGTGNLVLGDAAPGFTSFTAALQAGDQFYYSVVGLDKTAESEVGRGTLQSDGSIARDPISGQPTNFSGGRKSVALIAAAEWFDQVGAAVQIAAADRSALAALAASAGMTRYLTEAGREGIFVFDGSDRSGEVAADTRQGIYVATGVDPTGASGAWVRALGPEGVVDATWFDLLGDGAADNHSALSSALTLTGQLDGRKTVAVPAGRYALAQALSIPDGVTLEGSGAGTILIATGGAAGQPWIVNRSGGSNFAIRNLKMTPDESSVLYRAAISLTACTNARIENVVVEGQTDASAVYLTDCDSVVIDGLYFDGGATYRQGYGVYAIGCKGCKIVNSTALNCSQGFSLTGAAIDESSRTTGESFGNTIANCYVRWCKSHSFNVNSSTYNTITGCHAEDYAGTDVHKAFQSKDVSGEDTRGNVFVGCTVKNYPAGFGGQASSNAQFIGCTATGLSANGFELNGCKHFQVIGCSIHEFGGAGIWLGSSGTGNAFDGIKLETSTPTATGIKFDSLSGMSNNNFDNITTASTLAAFIDIAPACNNNRFGMGCRANDNAIIDASGMTVWPVVHTTPTVNLNAALTTGAAYKYRGMHVVNARWIAIGAVGGSPQVCVGQVGAASALGAQQAVSGASASVTNLALTTQLLTTGAVLSGTVTATGTGTGFFQFEGLPRF